MVKFAWVGTLAVALGVVGGCSGKSDSNGDEPADSSGGSGGSGGSDGVSTSGDTGGSGAVTSGGSGGSSASGGSTGSSGSGGVTSATASGVTGGSGGGANDLSGTWDVIVSQADGDASTATVTLSPTRLEVTGDGQLLALVADDVTTIAYEGDSARATRLSDGDMDLGALPLPFAGLLRFTNVPDDNDGCDLDLGPDALSLRCSDDISNPASLPPLEDSTLLATRADSRDSIFGDLGGRWQVSGDEIDCSILLEGNRTTLDCTEANGDAGIVTLTVDGDRISGSSSGGTEITAQRR